MINVKVSLISNNKLNKVWKELNSSNIVQSGPRMSPTSVNCIREHFSNINVASEQTIKQNMQLKFENNYSKGRTSSKWGRKPRWKKPTPNFIKNQMML